MVTTTVTVKANDLHAAFKSVLLFAGKDATLPMLAAVKLEIVGKELVAITTDRFRIGMVRVPIDTEVEFSDTFTTLINRTDVDNMVRVLATAKKDVEWRAVTLTVEALVTGRNSVSYRTTDGTSGSVTALDADFPKVRFLFPESAPELVDQEADRHSFAVSPAYMGDFAKAATILKARSMIIEPNVRADRPATVRIGSNFYGLIMPVRVNGSDVDSYDARMAWKDVTGK